MELIRTFKKITKKEVASAGGKGSSLGEMTQAGIHVPPGFVILSTAFNRFIDEAELNVEIHAALDRVNKDDISTIDSASEKMQAAILAAAMPKDIENAIADAFKKLNAEFVAVRSSATAEDSSSHAWAGQLDTYLNTTKENLLENVKKCWASLFTSRAIFYRFEKELHNTDISVAVVVQKMIESEVSGVAFSVHPVTQDRNQMIIEAVFGLGEAIVSGTVTPDSYVIEKDTRNLLDTNIGGQKKMLVQKKNEMGNEWKELDERHGNKQKLSTAQISKLAELIAKIEKHYGFPVDVEWALEKGKFYITQSRPITTL